MTVLPLLPLVHFLYSRDVHATRFIIHPPVFPHPVWLMQYATLAYGCRRRPRQADALSSWLRGDIGAMMTEASMLLAVRLLLLLPHPREPARAAAPILARVVPFIFTRGGSLAQWPQGKRRPSLVSRLFQRSFISLTRLLLRTQCDQAKFAAERGEVGSVLAPAFYEARPRAAFVCLTCAHNRCAPQFRTANPNAQPARAAGCSPTTRWCSKRLKL